MKFKLPENMDPTKPIWVELEELGEWATNGKIIIKKGIELDANFSLGDPWKLPSQALENCLKTVIPDQSLIETMKPHEGYFMPWTYPLMERGYKALCLGNEDSIAWMIRNNEIVMGVMPCDIRQRDKDIFAKQWPQPD
jgi:hypothetical protein